MRVIIKNPIILNTLFNSVRTKMNGTWASVRTYFSIPRSTFDNYRKGYWSMPKELFNKLIISLNDTEKTKILSNIEELPDNHGKVKGGKAAYLKNIEKFKEGRKLKKIHTKIEIEKLLSSFSSLKLSPEICELAGTFIGDGCFNVYKNKLYHIEFAGDIRYDLPYYKERIIPIIKSIIPDAKPHIYKPSSRENAVRIVIYSRKLFYFLKVFLEFTPGKKTYTVKIPEKIKNSGEENIRATLRGIFDTDGGITFDKRKSYRSPYPRISLTTASKNLFEDVKSYLSKHFQLYTLFVRNRQVYKIEIYGIEQLRKWMNLIGFSNKRHLNKIALVATAGRARPW